MDKTCETCKFRDLEKRTHPCGFCELNTYLKPHSGHIDWQPRKPRRKELQAQLDEVTAERDALKDAWAQDNKGSIRAMYAIAEQQLTHANAEIESMYNELAAKQAIIDQQEREYDEALATCTELADQESMTGVYFVHGITCGGCGKRVWSNEIHVCDRSSRE